MRTVDESVEKILEKNKNLKKEAYERTKSLIKKIEILIQENEALNNQVKQQ